MADGVLSTMPVKRMTGNSYTSDYYNPATLLSGTGPGVKQYAPSIQDILGNLKNVNLGESNLFKQGVTAATPSQGISPQTQNILNIIKQQQDYAQKQGVSQAQALAGRRGIAGSSTEQFGVQSAIEAAARSGQEATQQALGQDFQAQQALQQLQAQGLFQGAGQEMNVNATLNSLAANLTSDELASLRGMSDADKNRVLQEKLGNMGIAAQNYATTQARDAAKQANSPTNALLGGIGAAIPGVAAPF